MESLVFFTVLELEFKNVQSITVRSLPANAYTLRADDSDPEQQTTNA
jgi:hypothetical protein